LSPLARYRIDGAARAEIFGPEIEIGEPNYTGDTDDSASMNVWLHKQIMTTRVATGRKLPSDIKPDPRLKAAPLRSLL
jgi:hypothetical protein